MATYVLMHGAYQGGWIWQPVATRLRAAGHTVYAPTLDGCGERAHLLRPGITVGTQAQEMTSCCFMKTCRTSCWSGPVPGGWSSARAAELARERLARLVFVDALALLPGEQVGSIVNRAAPNETTALATGPTKADAERRLFADLTPTLRAWALARYTLHPRAALEAPMELDTFWEQSWPATVIRCTRSVNPPEAHQRRTAERLHAAWYELETGHYPMLSAPEARYQQASPRALLPLGVPQWHIVGRDDQSVPVDYVQQYVAVASHQDPVPLDILPEVGHFELVVPTTSAWATVRHAVLTLLARG